MVHARHRTAVETETLADGTDGLDADDGLDGGVVFGTRRHYDLHVLDLIAAQLVKFALVAHLPAVDVDERSARLHPNCAEFCTMTIFVNGLISNEGDAGEDWICFTGDDEETSLVTYASTYESRIRWMKQVNIGVCNGLTSFVNDGALVAGFRFLYAFHEDLLSFLFGTCSDADRIEAYHLLDGFGQMLVLDSCRDTKVLQFVVEEVDGVTRLLLTELSQRIREGVLTVSSRARMRVIYLFMAADYFTVI